MTEAQIKKMMATLKISREEARTQLDVSGSVLAILPGSRAPEIKYLLPIFLETADKLHDEIPGLHPYR